jgi:hypothetical protein
VPFTCLIRKYIGTYGHFKFKYRRFYGRVQENIREIDTC